MSSRLLVAALLFVVTVGGYAQVRDHEFVNLDDRAFIVANQSLREGFGLRAIARSFSEPLFGMWHPLTTLSYHVDYELHRSSVAGTLLTNVGLHALAAVLCFLAFARMSNAVWPSAFVAAVFALHPLHVESVAWASERKDVLSGLFFMGMLLAYARYAEAPQARGRYALVLLLLALGLLSKPTLVTAPFVLLLLDYWPLGRIQSEGDSPPVASRALRSAFLEKGPMFALAAGVSVVTYAAQAQGGATHMNEWLTLAVRLANALHSYAVYLGDAVWPSGLGFFYPHPLHGIPGWQLGLAGLVLVGATLAALLWLRSRPYVAVGWLWYLGTLLPMIGLIQVGQQARADRYMYLPLIGPSLIVAWGACDLLARFAWRRGALAIAGGAVVAVLAVVSWFQVGYWRNSLTLWERADAVTGDNYVAEQYIGYALFSAGRYEEALVRFESVARMRPTWAEPFLWKGNSLARLGDIEGAAASFQRALRSDPDHLKAHQQLGIVLVRLGRHDESDRHLSRVLDANAATAETHTAMGMVAATRGRAREAVWHYREALLLDPEMSNAANNLAWLRATHPDESLRDPEEAIRLARQALRGAERDPNALDTLAAGLAAAGRYEEAVTEAERAVEIARLAGHHELAASIESHLSLYQQGQPLVEVP